MEVRLTPEQETLFLQAVEDGRYVSVQAAINDALSRWVERERRRSEIVSALERSEADFKAGRFRVYTEETLDQFANEVIERSRAAQTKR